MYSEFLPFLLLVPDVHLCLEIVQQFLLRLNKEAKEAEYSIRNSKQFIEKAKNIIVEEGETLISYDVKALYPSIPQEEVLDLINQKLTNDNELKDRTPITGPNIMRLMKVCVNNTFFMFNGKLYKQIDGLAIGRSTSGFGAELYMYEFEKRALRTFVEPPDVWIRYVDDTFSKIKIEYVAQFLQHLNAIHPKIQFTVEEMAENSIAFLDIKVTVIQDNLLKFAVYHKPTHTDQYLNFNSNHHISQKLGLVSTLNYRIENLITTEEDKLNEKTHVNDALKNCNYPEWALKERPKANKRNKEENRGTVTIPYVKNISEKVAGLFRKYNIETVHKPSIKLKSLVCNMKDKIHPLDKTGAIYNI